MYEVWENIRMKYWPDGDSYKKSTMRDLIRITNPWL